MAKLTKPVISFFDFYTLNLLKFFCVEKSVNFGNREKRINELYSKVVNYLYSDIRKCLEYSVLREFRHFRVFTFGNDHSFSRHDFLLQISEDLHELNKIVHKIDANHLKYKKINLDYNENIYDEVKFCNFNFDLNDVYYGFDFFNWEKYYGGKLWAKAVAFLFEKPKTEKEKEFWVDRVLDLQHNSGFILDKTKYFRLSLKRQFKTPNKKNKTKTIDALTYRRNCSNVTQLAQFCSHKVKKTCNINKGLLPEKLR